MPVNRGKRKSAIGKKSLKQGDFFTIPKSKILEKLRKQRERDTLQKQISRATSAKNKFRTRKEDRGKLVFVGVDGQREPQKKNRKGYLVYVTKTGKKRLVRDVKHSGGFHSKKINDLNPPMTRNLSRAVKEFHKSQRVLISKHSARAAVKGRTAVEVSGVNDFNDKVVTKLARSLKKTIESQASRRQFLINANVLVTLPDKTEKVFKVQVPIAKADHIAIDLGGMQNFMRKKFYAFMARELAFEGFVTSGSANHIRRLSDNEGEDDRQEWVNANGESWAGADLEIVRIQSIEWKIEQIK